MKGDRTYPWWIEPVSTLAALLLRVLGATWRIERLGLEPVEDSIASGQRVLFALWHARLLPLLVTHRGRHAAVLVSRSRDGELITRVIEKLGFVTARGSSTRGAREGALEMLEWARRGHLLAITPDGPRGPAERVKPGLAWLAVRAAVPVVPVASAARPALALRSWDRFRVPLPFARVWIAYGEPITVPAVAAEGAEEPWRARLEGAIASLTREVAGRAGEVA